MIEKNLNAKLLEEEFLSFKKSISDVIGSLDNLKPLISSIWNSLKFENGNLAESWAAIDQNVSKFINNFQEIYNEIDQNVSSFVQKTQENEEIASRTANAVNDNIMNILYELNEIN